MKPLHIIWVSRSEMPGDIGERIKNLCILKYLRNNVDITYVVSNAYPSLDHQYLDSSEIRVFPTLSFFSMSTNLWFRYRTKRFVQQHRSCPIRVQDRKTAQNLLRLDLDHLIYEMLNPAKNKKFLKLHHRSFSQLLVQNKRSKHDLLQWLDRDPDSIGVFRSSGIYQPAGVETLSSTRQWIYFGSLHVSKNIPFMIRLAREIPSDVQIKIIGGDTDEHTRLSEKHGPLPDNLKLQEILPSDQLLEEIHKSELSLFVPQDNTFNRLYTSPMKIYQSILTQRPILTLKYPSIQEIQKEVQEGLITVETTDKFMEKCLEFAQSPRPLHDLINRMENMKMEHLTWDARARRLLDFLQSYPRS